MKLCEELAIGEVNSKISNLKSIEVIYVSLQDRVTFCHRQGDRGGLLFELRLSRRCSDCSKLNRRGSG